MPAPQADMMKQLIRAKFMSFQIKVPTNWQKPAGEDGSDNFNNAYASNELNVQPGTPPLFLPATMNLSHVNTQKELIVAYGELFDGLATAICSAWSTWQSAATLVGVMINAVTASAGQVVGPPLTPLILAQGPKANPFQLKYTTAVANTLGTAWLSFTSSIKVPGMPWYPAFAAVPAPIAPPMPNIPCPVAALTSVPVSMSPMMLKNQMVGALADPTMPFADKVFEALADAIDKVFQIWKTSTMVMNVLGTGPVPTFAPPVVPVGPVVAGVGTMTPGGFV